MKPELMLDNLNIKTLYTTGAKKIQTAKQYLFNFTYGEPARLDIVNTNNQRLSIIILTREQAENAWRTQLDGKDYLFITGADVMV